MRNKVVQGDNDLLTWCNNNGELGQLLKSQWVGYDIDKNAIDITSIAKSANKKVLWKCGNGHYWFAMVNNRTKASRHSMCPYCVGKKKTEPTDIARWCVNHDKAYLLDEWVGMADDGTKLDINKITYGSKVKALWKCKYNHTWFARPNDR